MDANEHIFRTNDDQYTCQGIEPGVFLLFFGCVLISKPLPSVLSVEKSGSH